MKILLPLVAAIATLSMFAVPPRVSVRAATGSKYARITAIVQPRPEHRALIITGTVIDDEGWAVWDRVSAVQLEGENSRRQHVFSWPGVAPGRLHVRAEVVGLCGSAEAVGMVGW